MIIKMLCKNTNGQSFIIKIISEITASNSGQRTVQNNMDTNRYMYVS